MTTYLKFLRSLVNVIILCAMVPTARATLRQWTGAQANDSRWSMANNWVSGPPVAGDDLLFPPGALQPSNNDDFPGGSTFGSIIISGGGYSLGGNAIALNAGLVVTNTSGDVNSVNNALILNSNQTFNIHTASGSFFLPTAVNLNGNALTLDVASGSLAQIQGVLSGTGSLLKTGIGSALLYASNTFSGPVEILQGGMNIYDGHALGDTNGNTFVGSGATLALANIISVAEPLMLAGSLNSSAPGQIWTGPITLSGPGATILVASGDSLAVNAVISGTVGFTKSAGGQLTLNSNNTYAGASIVTGGFLQVNGSQPASPIVLTGGALSGAGAVGAVTFSSIGSSSLSPGVSGPGVLTCGNLALYPSTFFLVDVNGAAPGSGYDQLQVNGVTALSNAVLSLSLGFTPALGSTFTLLYHEGNEPIAGTFAGLPQGALLTNGATIFRISYTGGDGNDVTLTTTLGAPPSTLTSISSLPDGSKQLTGQGVSNLTYAVEAATNLSLPISWTNIGPAAANASGVFQFSDTNAPSFPTRFYRALSP
jgi:autotransporter-associated beta strand protein